MPLCEQQLRARIGFKRLPGARGGYPMSELQRLRGCQPGFVATGLVADYRSPRFVFGPNLRLTLWIVAPGHPFVTLFLRVNRGPTSAFHCAVNRVRFSR
jgi:hypothetical protein